MGAIVVDRLAKSFAIRGARRWGNGLRRAPTSDSALVGYLPFCDPH